MKYAILFKNSKVSLLYSILMLCAFLCLSDIVYSQKRVSAIKKDTTKTSTAPSSRKAGAFSSSLTASQKATASAQEAMYSIKNKPPTIPTQSYQRRLQKIQKNPEKISNPKVIREIKSDIKSTISKQKELARLLNLGRGDKKTAKQISSMISKNRSSTEIKKSWTVFIETIVSGNKPVDITALIQWELLDVYLEMAEELEFLAAKLKSYNDAKKAIRKHLQNLRQLQKPFARSKIVQTDSMGMLVVKQGVMLSNWQDINAHMDKMEEWLISINGYIQAIDVQTEFQKQQQTIQMLSSVSCTLHDTAMAVIRKMG